MKNINRTISIAPMMDYTDKHFRYFMRILHPQILLYTEMITTKAILYGNHLKLLSYSNSEHPLALQLGGSDPKELAKCCEIANQYNYDEINLNVGCPSSKVQSGKFGVCLMKEPETVAECVNAMQQVATAAITVKTRIGVDELDSYADLCNFISIVKQTDCRCFIIHARKAWLNGLSPKENRQIPPLKYSVVYALKQDFPELEIIINGGINSIDQVQQHLQHTDGVMVGRQACKQPFFMAELGNKFLSRHKITPKTAIKKYIPYMQSQIADGTRITPLIKPILGLNNGEQGAKKWRQFICTNTKKPTDLIQYLYDYSNS